VTAHTTELFSLKYDVIDSTIFLDATPYSLYEFIDISEESVVCIFRDEEQARQATSKQQADLCLLDLLNL
jgi:hypothetical protein